jgi:hypothetical protein
VRGTGNRLIAMKIRTDSVFGGQFFCGWAFVLGKAAFSGVFDGWEIAGLDRCREGGI